MAPAPDGAVQNERFAGWRQEGQDLLGQDGLVVARHGQPNSLWANCAKSPACPWTTFS